MNKNNPHKQFPGKMDKTVKKTYKTTFRMGYGKLKHVKLFENFDQEEKLSEAFTPEELDSIKEVIKKTSFMNLQKPLEELGFVVNTETYDQPLPPIIINVRKNKNDKEKVAILNRKYVGDSADFVHGEIAMGIMEKLSIVGFPLNEVQVKVKATEEVETTKSARVKRSVLVAVEDLYKKINEYKAMQPIIKAMEDKAQEIAILKDELIPELQKYNAQSFRIEKFLVELQKDIKMKGERTTYQYADVVKDLAKISKKMEALVEDTKELHKTVHPAEAMEKYDLSVTKVDEGVVDWIKDVFGQLSSKFKSLWGQITGNVDELENYINELSKSTGIAVPSTADAIKEIKK